MFKNIALGSAIQLKDECSCSILANQKTQQTLTNFHKIIMNREKIIVTLSFISENYVLKCLSQSLPLMGLQNGSSNSRDYHLVLMIQFGFHSHQGQFLHTLLNHHFSSRQNFLQSK